MLPTLPSAALQAADTVVMLQARDGLATASLVASIVLTTAVVAILVVIIPAMIQLRRQQKLVNDLMARFEKRAEPIIDRGGAIAANVEFITAALRTDVQTFSSSVHSLSDRLQLASDRMEQRIEDFNALMEVVQGEAENMFIGSVATARGVRAGVHALRHGPDGEELPDDDELLDDDDLALADEFGLPPRALVAPALETAQAPLAAPGGVQVTASEPGVPGRGTGTP